MRRLAKMRLYAEGLVFPSTGAFRPMVVFTTHYELALRQLAKVAGERYAESVDKEFDFPYRDQFNGHPAAVRLAVTIPANDAHASSSWTTCPSTSVSR